MELVFALYSQVGVKKESNSRRLVYGWRVFVAVLTIAILATIGGVVGYYISISKNNQGNAF